MSIAAANLAKMDRELFSELVEPPIQPALLYMQPLKLKGLDPNFVLHISCELLFSWRKRRQSNAVFRALQANLFSNAYTLRESCAARLGKLLITHILHISKDLKEIKKSDKRKERKERWVAVLINEDEVESMPSDVVKLLVDRIKELEGDNAELTARLDEQGEELFEAMSEINTLKNESGANRGKSFLEVGGKQQKRNLEKIRYVRQTFTFLVSISIVVAAFKNKFKTQNSNGH